MLTTIVLGLLIFIIIFLFKTRIIQLRFCIVAIILDLLLIFLYYKATQNYSTGAYSITAISHVVIILSLFFAARGISKDEKLVKDSNRLR
jgi:hypothetical protein